MKIAMPAFNRKTPNKINPSQINNFSWFIGKPVNLIRSTKGLSVDEIGVTIIATYGPINPRPAKSRNEELRKSMIIQAIFLRSSPSRNKISFKYCIKSPKFWVYQNIIFYLLLYLIWKLTQTPNALQLMKKIQLEQWIRSIISINSGIHFLVFLLAVSWSVISPYILKTVQPFSIPIWKSAYFLTTLKLYSKWSDGK